MSTAARLSLLIVLAAVAASACGGARAATPVDRPALEVPPPPPRVIAQVPAPEPPLPELAEDPSAAPKPAPPARNTRPAGRDTKEPPKPEPKAETPAADPPAQQPAPAPQLRMPDTGDAGTVSRQIRDIIERSRRALGQIDRVRLTTARQKAYDDAQLFAKQAEDALNANNLLFAKELADKADRLTKELTGR